MAKYLVMVCSVNTSDFTKPADELCECQPSSERRAQSLIISGSPFAGGKTEKAAELMHSREQEQGVATKLIYLSRLSIAGCRGCNTCACLQQDKTGAYYCIIEDDMQDLVQKLQACTELTLVTPIYFSGAPSQLKAVLDRLQPFFWSRQRGGDKRPFDLVILGEGGDPYGYEPLVSEAKSSLAVAGFKLRETYDWVG